MEPRTLASPAGNEGSTPSDDTNKENMENKTEHTVCPDCGGKITVTEHLDKGFVPTIEFRCGCGWVKITA
jgi:ribosomal protein S27AE